jgi:Icc-related predicted phosphoesterase
MQIVATSDTHTRHRALTIPECDLFIHAGDITMQGEPEVYADFDDWLATVPARHKVVIAGNHDFDCPGFRNATYLHDSSVVIDGLTVYGSPVTPWFGDWAYVKRRPIRWNIPECDILVTHGPPFGILDTVDGRHPGCEELAIAVSKIKPKLHVFGHIHEGYGIVERAGTVYVNAAHGYHGENQPICLTLPT